MSNDLISRSALLESVNYYYTHTPNDSPEHYAYGVALKEIREHPTAFDKKRVIEELDKLTGEECTLHECGIRSERCKPCIAKKAIEIVKKGGIE